MKILLTRAERLRLDTVGKVEGWGVQPVAEKGWNRHWGCRRIYADEMAVLKPYWTTSTTPTANRPSA
jgi:hypothetical protein